MHAHRRPDPTMLETYYKVPCGLCGQNRTVLGTGRSGTQLASHTALHRPDRLTVSLFSSTHCFSFVVLSAEIPITVTPEPEYASFPESESRKAHASLVHTEVPAFGKKNMLQEYGKSARSGLPRPLDTRTNARGFPFVSPGVTV